MGVGVGVGRFQIMHRLELATNGLLGELKPSFGYLAAGL